MAEFVPDTASNLQVFPKGNLWKSTTSREDEFQEQLRATDAPFSSAVP
jgi:hypothetical protein